MVVALLLMEQDHVTLVRFSNSSFSLPPASVLTDACFQSPPSSRATPPAMSSRAF